MTKQLIAILAVTATVCALSGCGEAHNSALTKPPGTYKQTYKSTDRNGTDMEKTTETDVSVDEYGNKKAVVTTKTKTDPKGLFNSKTTKTKDVYEEK